MFRTNTCGELRLADAGKTVTLAGWVQRVRKMGGMTFVDLRDRYGITQLVFNEEVNDALCARANKLGREDVIQIKGEVNERESKNKNLPTGEIEIIVSELTVLNASVTPPFTIEDNTDGRRRRYPYEVPLFGFAPCLRAEKSGTPPSDDDGGSPLLGQQRFFGNRNTDADRVYS